MGPKAKRGVRSVEREIEAMACFVHTNNPGSISPTMMFWSAPDVPSVDLLIHVMKIFHTVMKIKERGDSMAIGKFIVTER